MIGHKRFTKVFLSHATPEDNYFVVWLASKLNLLGYDIWCDVEELKGGEDFWKDIEVAIRDQAIKFLFVVSDTSIHKNGTLKELAVADKIRDRGDFIIPLRLEAVPHASFPVEIIRLNAIEFSENWASGLAQLTEKLESESTPRQRSFAADKIREWWRTGTLQSDALVTNREERYWTNWFSCKLPTSIYLHKLFDPNIKPEGVHYPIVAIGDWIVSFACSDCLQEQVKIERTEKVEFEEFCSDRTYQIPETDFVVADPNNKIIELLNLAFIDLTVRKGLKLYELSHGIVSYFPSLLSDNVATSRVKLDQYGLTHVSLVGVSKDANWHYGIQARAFLYPISGLGISHHIIFTQNGNPLDAEKQHKLRRKLGASWYNKQWRDRLLAAMTLLTDDRTQPLITMPVCCSQSVTVEASPEQFTSPIGFIDPK